MANEIKVRYAISGRDIYAVVINAAGQIWNTGIVAFETIEADNWDDYTIDMNEQDATQIYYGDEPSGLDNHVEYDLLFYDPGATSITASDNTFIGTGVLHERGDIYHADIQLAKDNTNSRDEYTIIWFQNGVRVTSGITGPTIQVINRADGNDLIGSIAMTQIGSTGSYKYDTGTNRITLGEAVLVVVVATIDGLSRTFSKVINRDS